MVSSSSRLRPSENVTVVIEISGGSFADGFRVNLQILRDGRPVYEDDDLDIPPAPEIPQLYNDWQNILGENSRALQAVPGQVTNVAAWRAATEKLEQYIRRWFQNRAFRNLRNCILADHRISRTDQPIPIIIRVRPQAENAQQHEILRRIPWHIWDLFQERGNVEFAIFNNLRDLDLVPPLTSPVRILAIFGSHAGLKLEQDRQALELLEQRGAEITPILEPSPEEITRLLLGKEWQILFFAGHSASQGTSGLIQIGDNRFLRVEDLSQSLRSAVRRGLKLAIFNSCDGLGIADFLSGLQIPSVIVMKEPVPDYIAGQFLIHLLREFSNGTPLCLAVRQARDRLEVLQHDFPAATWLPVAILNPIQSQFIWPEHTPDTIPPIDGTKQPDTIPPIDGTKQPDLIPPIDGTKQPDTILHKIKKLTNLLTRLPRWIRLGLLVLLTFIIIALPNIRSLLFPVTSKPPETDKIEKFISRGEKPIPNSIVKLSEPYLSLKLKGIKALSGNEYKNASAIFYQLREQAKKDKDNQSDPALREAALAVLKDPEILIYRNNAEAHIKNPKSPIIYTIAVTAPLNKTPGRDILFGVALAQEGAVNQKGINLQILISSDENKPTQAREVAEKLVVNEKVLAVIGTYTSANTCAFVPVYSEHKLPVISPTSSVVNLREDCGDKNKVFFRTVSSTEKEASSLVQYLINERKKYQPKVVILYDKNEIFSKDLFEQFKKELRIQGGSIIAEFDNLSQSNFDISRVEKEIQNADAIALLPDGGTDDSPALKNAIEIIKLNNGKKPIVGANTLYFQEMISQAKNTAVDSLFLAVDWHQNQCGAAAFAEKINNTWYGNLNRRTALAHDAVQAILQAIKLIKLSGSSVNRDNILQKLSETDTKPETAAASETIQDEKISFFSNGDRVEIKTRVIVSVNQKQEFYIKKNLPLKDGSCPTTSPKQ